MAKYAITMWQTAKYEIVFDADNIEDAREFLNGKTSVNQLQECDVIFVKGAEMLSDPFAVRELTEDELLTLKGENNE
jgi:hypothetical protein